MQPVNVTQNLFLCEDTDECSSGTYPCVKRIERGENMPGSQNSLCG